MHTPKYGKSLRSFLGFFNFVKQFMANFSTLKYTFFPSHNASLEKGSQF